MASATSPCQVVLCLAHLLKQHQHQHHALTVDYYEIEKSALLTASVQCATELASVVKEAMTTTTGIPPPMTTTTTTVGEVHLIMTGSPRPTFAETNAWLLEDAQQQQKQAETPEKKKGDVNIMATGKRPELLAGSLSILDNHVSFATVTKDDNDMEEEEEREGNNLEQLLLSNATPTKTTVGGEAAIVNTNFIRRHTAPASTTTTKTFAGPMVGQAVVNAINQTHGVGLQSNRSKLLQGTIDRPEWIQSRWTDGECVFGELVQLCGLHSFENTSAAGGSSPSSSKLQHQLRKTTNLSAHLITVPVILSTTAAAKAAATLSSSKGMEEETMEEIARGILRCLKRKGSASVSNIYLLVPPPSSSLSRKDTEGSAAAEAATIISALLKKAFDKLEQYNDMIGMSRLMANVCFVVVHVVCNYNDDKR
jgi:hypothetical protein